jgi:hypothetical protein
MPFAFWSGSLVVVLALPVLIGVILWWTARPTVLVASSARLAKRVRTTYRAGLATSTAAFVLIWLGLILDLMGVFHGLTPRSAPVIGLVASAGASFIVGLALMTLARRPHAAV